jgi:hypothetical protein
MPTLPVGAVMKRNVIILLLAGCAPALQVHAQNPQSITIEYHRVWSDLGEALAQAEAHCRRYDKSAVVTTNLRGSRGNREIIVAECR